MRLTVRALTLGFVLAALVRPGIVGGQRAQSANPLPGEIGSWALNLANSHYDPGPAPKSQIMLRELVAQGVRVTRKILDAEGKPLETVATLTYDGKEYPVKGNPAYDSTS